MPSVNGFDKLPESHREHLSPIIAMQLPESVYFCCCSKETQRTEQHCNPSLELTSFFPLISLIKVYNPHYCAAQLKTASNGVALSSVYKQCSFKKKFLQLKLLCSQRWHDLKWKNKNDMLEEKRSKTKPLQEQEGFSFCLSQSPHRSLSWDLSMLTWD